MWSHPAVARFSKRGSMLLWHVAVLVRFGVCWAWITRPSGDRTTLSHLFVSRYQAGWTWRAADGVIS
jgi:hypothetical protein